MKTVPEIIRDSLLDAIAINSPQGYALIGERVVEALKANGYDISQPKRCEPPVSPDELAHFTAIFDAALIGDLAAVRAFRGLQISTCDMRIVGLYGTIKHVVWVIDRMQLEWKRTANRSFFFGEDSGVRANEPVLKASRGEEPDPLEDLLEIASITPPDESWKRGSFCAIPTDGSLFLVRFDYKGQCVVHVGTVIDPLKKFISVIGTVGKSRGYRLYPRDKFEWIPLSFEWTAEKAA